MTTFRYGDTAMFGNRRVIIHHCRLRSGPAGPHCRCVDADTGRYLGLVSVQVLRPVARESAKHEQDAAASPA